MSLKGWPPLNSLQPPSLPTLDLRRALQGMNTAQRTVVKPALPQEVSRPTALWVIHMTGVIVFYCDQGTKPKSASLPRDVGRRRPAAARGAGGSQRLWV